MSGRAVTSRNTDAGRRLLEHLQQRVLGRAFECVRLVDDRHAAAAFEWAVAGAVDGIAHRIDLDVALVVRLENQDVGVDTASDARARGTDTAGVQLWCIRRFSA